jgi:hypothetical protein
LEFNFLILSVKHKKWGADFREHITVSITATTAGDGNE